MQGKLILGILSTGLLSFGAAVALAQGDTIPTFDELDADGDGYISRGEAQVLPCLGDGFDQVTTESASGMNRDEYQRAVQQLCAQ